MTTYSSLSKAELLLVLEQRDSEVIELLTQLEKDSVQSKLSVITKETKLLGKDLLKLIGYLFNAGVKVGSLFKQVVPVKKLQGVEEGSVPLSFNY
jgi:hypothetical protein